MGLIYSYDIYLRPKNVARALKEAAKLAPPERRVPPLTVTLPGGEQVLLPFTCGFKSEPVDCAGRDRVPLETSLMFPADEAVRAYAEEGGLPVEDGRVQVGYVYLDMSFPAFRDPGYVCLDFWAATSRMSRLFEDSAAIGRCSPTSQRRRVRWAVSSTRGTGDPNGCFGARPPTEAFYGRGPISERSGGRALAFLQRVDELVEGRAGDIEYGLARRLRVADGYAGGGGRDLYTLVAVARA